MSNVHKDEITTIRTIRRCLKKKWYSVEVNDLRKGLKYKIQITPIKLKENE